MSRHTSVAGSVPLRVAHDWIRKLFSTFSRSALTASPVPLYAVDQTIHPEDQLAASAMAFTTIPFVGSRRSTSRKQPEPYLCSARSKQNPARTT